MHVKNYFKVSKIIKSTVLDKSFRKSNVFELNLQSTLILKEIRRGKTKEILVLKRKVVLIICDQMTTYCAVVDQQ